MPIKIEKHAYTTPEPSDGTRILVTRYWLRGLKREKVDQWISDLAPSKDLLQEYLDLRDGGNSTDDRENFFLEWSGKYLKEMKTKADLVQNLRQKHLAGETLTLLCACHDPKRCHRSLLKDLIENG